MRSGDDLLFVLAAAVVMGICGAAGRAQGYECVLEYDRSREVDTVKKFVR